MSQKYNIPNSINEPSSSISNLPPKKAEKEVAQLFIKQTTQRAITVHRILIKGLYIAAICVGILFIVRILHFILPLCWHWLGEDQIKDIDKFLFSGAVGALLGKFTNDLFNPRQ